ncbi:glutaminase A [Nonomuraea zeae]|uniref:Glutaminase n=1 Tax=Nonomuraea zeae TaxID=1642303 RepID=A0A5S4GZF0_9ACTN|nr:glutaminase A [Nonomuraea zeae]TMR38042.1 glutaminase A [Nonomuraea zeae]
MSPLQWRELLTGVLAEAAEVDGGRVASYVPALAATDPSLLALAVATPDGDVAAVGDRDVPFALMSAAKPFTYALALAEHGFAKVHEHVGAEPSGARFDATATIDGSGVPYNPMTNMGAIVTASLIGGRTFGERRDRVLECLSRFAGRPLDVSAAVLDSQRLAGDRNKALAYLAHGSGCLAGDPAETVDRYFTQCATLVTVGDLAVMAATLACGGVNPRTGERVVGADVARTVLAVMTTCGMYDASGSWLVRSGLPAKSGVAGCVAAALPGRIGIAAYSPPVDERGNSVRAMAACARLADRLDLHLLSARRPPEAGSHHPSGAV